MSQSHDSTAGADRRRLEAEMLMYQSDRAKLLRQRMDLEMEKRVLKKEIELKTLEMHRKDEEERKLIADVQGIENELLRLRKRFNLLT